jgi:adenylate kinase family enzyme
MNRIVIIGPPGAGKSSLARELGSINNITVYHLDRLFWFPEWKEKPKDDRIDILQNIVRERQWVIDGTYLNTSELHLETADTIIFLGIPPFVCIWRLLKRHQEYDRRSRRDIPMGSTDKLTLFLILKVIGFPFQSRRTLHQRLRNYNSKQIFWFRSTREVEVFLSLLIPHTDKKMQFSKKLSLARKRQLAAAKR